MNRPTSRAAGGFFATGVLLGLTSLLVMLAGTGCTAGGGAGEEMTVENLPDGLVRITHHALPSRNLNADTLAAWDLWSDGGDYIFNRIAGVAACGEGFLLLDAGNAQVVEVDAEGKVLRDFRLEQYMWFLDGIVPIDEGRILSAVMRSGTFEDPEATTYYYSGAKVREISAPAPDLAVTEKDRRWFFEEQGLAFGINGERFEATPASLEKYPFAERRQAVGGLRVDPAGRIWVQAATPDPGTHRLDIFAPDGSYLGALGKMPLPAAFTSDGHALLRAEDEDGIEQFYVISIH